MTLNKFRTYQLAVNFYQKANAVRLPIFLKDQFDRASSSICLNLAEGSAKASPKERHHFYRTALASQRECISILDLAENSNETLKNMCDNLGGHLYKLVKSEQSKFKILYKATDPTNNRD